MSREAYIAAARRHIAGMTLEQAARYCCGERMSKTQACEVMQIHHQHLASVLDAMPRLNWPRRGQSNAYLDAQDRQRFVCPPAKAESLARAREKRLADQVYTLRGQSGTLPELYAYFGSGISLRQVQRRVAEGMSLEDALFTPPTKSNQHRNDSPA
ncbi:hypothetical protein BJP27_24500 (plasmid) [Pseudomonas oryzihabitans]|nr:hypothetical protein BJP27_23850 [Pseudomonas psychrotolerans]APQ14733.1 hypothetical protein BJP27_24500 [Pseudomonas psychrotolerans]